MKTTQIITRTAIILLMAVSLFSSCKKKETNKEPEVIVTEPEETGQSSTDNRDANTENDVAVDDINNIIGDQPKLRGFKTSAPSNQVSGVTGTVGGLTLDTTGLSTGTIKLNYDGTTWNNRTRTGSIRLTILNYTAGKRWKDVGCVIKVEYLNYKVVRASDGASIQLDGVQNLTNISGGTWWEFLIIKTQTSMVTTITGTNLKVMFKDGKTATYNINRRSTLTLPGGILTATAEGIGTSGALSSLENFGTTRDGDAFTSQVVTPIVWNTTCGSRALVQGDIKLNVASKGFELRCLFGVDAAGNPVTVGTNQCPYGWKMSWTVNNTPKTKVFGYN